VHTEFEPFAAFPFVPPPSIGATAIMWLSARAPACPPVCLFTIAFPEWREIF